MTTHKADGIDDPEGSPDRIHLSEEVKSVENFGGRTLIATSADEGWEDEA